MWFRLETITEPILASNGHIEQGRTQVNEWDIEAPAIKSDDSFIVFRHIPEGGQQLGFVNAGDEFDRSGLKVILLVIFSNEEHLPARGFDIKHGNTNDLCREGPKTALFEDFGTAGHARRFIIKLRALPEKIFLLRIIKSFQGQSGALDVKNKFGH